MKTGTEVDMMVKTKLLTDVLNILFPVFPVLESNGFQRL